MFDVWLENRTPFEAATHVQMDSKGQEVLLVMISSTFAAKEDGSLDLAAQQVPVCFGDEHLGDAAHTSIRMEADTALIKPLVDVIVNGMAYSPNGRPSSEVMVGIKLVDIRKVLRVSGDRFRTFGIWLSKPKPFIRMPIIYERAFGGTTESGAVYAKNPIGVGYRGAASADPSVLTQVPNVGYPNRLVRRFGNRTMPAGFGSIGRGWAPRLAYAGTYDQAWIDKIWPLPPPDFNPLHNQSAPMDQQSKVIRGGEAVELINLTPSGKWRFRLPQLDFPIHLIFGDRVEKKAIHFDTVLIDAEQQTVTLKSRFTVQTVRNTPKLRVIVLGHISRGWVNARLKRKAYLSAIGGDGSLRNRSTFRL